LREYWISLIWRIAECVLARMVLAVVLGSFASLVLLVCVHDMLSSSSDKTQVYWALAAVLVLPSLISVAAYVAISAYIVGSGRSERAWMRIRVGKGVRSHFQDISDSHLLLNESSLPHLQEAGGAPGRDAPKTRRMTSAGSVQETAGLVKIAAASRSCAGHCSQSSGTRRRPTSSVRSRNMRADRHIAGRWVLFSQGSVAH
jgi:hypothetical protein